MQKNYHSDNQYYYTQKWNKGVCMQSASDYSPFGVLLDERSMQKTGYRYGFQSQEKDDETLGEGNFINYRFRGYNPKIGRLGWSLDPASAEYPELSTYQFSSNRVIDYVELEGQEGINAQFILKIGGLVSIGKKSFLSIISSIGVSAQAKMTQTTLSGELFAQGRINLKKSNSSYFVFGGMLGVGDNSNQAGIFTAGNSNGNNYMPSDYRPTLGNGVMNEKEIKGNDFIGAGISSITTFGRNNKTSLMINARMDIGGVKFTDEYSQNSDNTFYDIKRNTKETTLNFSYSIDDQNFGLGLSLLTGSSIIEYSGSIFNPEVSGDTQIKGAFQTGATFSFQNGLENINVNVFKGGSKFSLGSSQRIPSTESLLLNYNFSGKRKGFSLQLGVEASSNRNGKKLGE
jgi:RHS repeat-associated protein